jgi:membrane protease YdiL (CAAX protease family)
MNRYLEFAARGRNNWWRYLLTPIMACLLTGLGGLVLVAVLLLAHMLPPDLAEQMRQPKNVAPFFLSIGISFGMLAASLAVAAALIHRKRPKDLIGAWRWQIFALGLCAWMVVQAVLALIDLAIAPHGFALSANRGTLSLATTAFAGILAQTFAEEFIFRGYVTQGLLLAFKRPWPAALVSGLLFGSLHIANGTPQAVNAVIFGVVCALIAIRTGGIALTCGLHLANNYFGAVIVVSASDVFQGSPGIISQTTPQLVWWDLLLAAAALAGALWLVLRRPYFSAETDG